MKKKSTVNPGLGYLRQMADTSRPTLIGFITFWIPSKAGLWIANLLVTSDTFEALIARNFLGILIAYFLYVWNIYNATKRYNKLSKEA